MSTGADPSARVIDGRFTLVRRLGSGGMGMVWRARDEALHRDVALKEVRPPDPALAEHDPESARTLRARVLREARALARLDHPNVVTIHHIVDPGETGYPWIVMELVEGSSLQERLAEGPMSPAEAAELGRGVLSALRAAHAAGIHHRDVKPANVLLRTDGRPVLTDFGIAAIRESTSLTATGALIGSPDYIAPERIRGTEGDPSSDLWSLGMMLYVAVEGHHPLRRASTLATLAAVLDEQVPPPVRAGALAPVLDALLTRDTAARPDAETLDRMLAAAAAPADVSAPAPPAGSPDTLRLSGSRPQPPSGPATRPPAAGPSPSPPGAGSHHAPWSPPPAGASTTPDHALEKEREARVRRRIHMITAATSLTGTLVTVGVLLFLYGPLSSDDDKDADRPTATASSPSGDRGAAPSPRVDATPVEDTQERTVDLLTPDGARQVVKGLEKVMGGTRVTDFTLYGEHASANAPLAANPKLYDRYTYRDGRAEREDAGGTLSASDTPVDLAKVDWDKLPSLLADAEKSLNIPDPDSRYVIVDPSSPFHDDRPVLRVYVSDDYGGAFLTAELDGKIIERNPRDSG
ncbi:MULTISPECIES: serine/threonine-protein kinase [Streptomyces]|uniref:serine/threonine-protein kinase n=1 Tax=Streptomyces TaxID=1883 RepID=UPI00081B625C|nr:MULTISPECIES: serine/threonine-protein kinase [unclassified Streptomyces]MYQ55272.1 protein kinase [Streptomyces sp. SID4941]SCE35385.1 Serine/threonine protein kinase [Streptomyces sp. PalvLS-984]SDD50631.1 Serine/threonine protein kinase [Streptomyces sp. AmelKG-A3]